MLDEQGDADQRAATIKTIADALSLSPSTVSRALRGEAKVRPATTKRVLAAAEELGYRRDYRGVNLRTGRTSTLCAILASNPTLEFGDPATMHLIQGMIEGVEKSELKLVIEPVTGEREQFAEMRDAVEASRFDGIILDHTVPNDRRVDYLIERKVPFITFGRTERSSEHAFFDLDNEHAAYTATKNLADRGHTRIALIDPPAAFLFSAQRRRGYESALADAGLKLDPALIAETSINPMSVRQAVMLLRARGAPPTAFVTSNEVATIAAIKTCRALGLDLSEIGFASRDGTRFFDFIEPPVLSCFYPLLTAGRILSEALVALVHGAPVTDWQQVEKTEFISRS